ncbi:MAG: hypothetical protein V7K21_27895, partial [Nostoc sp.]|uniref:hypothetical protein n=1 Tax=Nostoc sp. TaxID=1180 RepID=UPI002FF9EC2D
HSIAITLPYLLCCFLNPLLVSLSRLNGKSQVLESVLKRNSNYTGLDYLESPDFYFPTRECSGSVLLAEGDYREFKKVSPMGVLYLACRH